MLLGRKGPLFVALCFSFLTEVYQIDLTVDKLLNKDGQQGNCEIRAGNKLECEDITNPDKLRVALKNNPDAGTVVLRNSILSHLPLLTEDPGRSLATLELDNSFLALFAPPIFRSDEDPAMAFLKKTKVQYLTFRGVSYVHALDWSSVSKRIEIISVEDSRFLFLPASLKDMTRLTTISVVNSHLKWIPKEAFQKHPSLSTIILSGNEIETLETGTFEMSGENSHLIIDLSNNRLKSLPPNVFNTCFGDFGSIKIILNNNPLDNILEDTFGSFCFAELHLNGTNLKCEPNYHEIFKEKKNLKVCGHCKQTDDHGEHLKLWKKYFCEIEKLNDCGEIADDTCEMLFFNCYEEYFVWFSSYHRF